MWFTNKYVTNAYVSILLVVKVSFKARFEMVTRRRRRTVRRSRQDSLVSGKRILCTLVIIIIERKEDKEEALKNDAPKD